MARFDIEKFNDLWFLFSKDNKQLFGPYRSYKEAHEKLEVLGNGSN